jgi:hypothetical protein
MVGISWVFWLLFWLLIALLLFVLLLWLLARRGIPCILCDFLGPYKPEFGSERAPPKRGSIRIPSDVYKRPDPLIYAQYFLMSQGLAVTWDNPDIWLESVDPADSSKPSGAVVPSHKLTQNTDYFVIAQVWNGSVEAPAIDLPVFFSFLTFGIGTTSTFIGMTKVDLPAKGQPGCPAFAITKWRTPAAPGHYCLQTYLAWPDDAQPGNNLGQENTDVKALNSPRAVFSFPVRNDSGVRRAIALAVDTYRLPARPACVPSETRGLRPALTNEEIARQRRIARADHDRSKFPVPPGWTVKTLPAELVLGPGEQQTVTFDVLAPDGFKGEQSFNVGAFVGDRLVGGVTLTVTGDGH